MAESSDKTFSFACPECFVSLKARVSQAGARLACPSCSASIVVPEAPAPKSIAGQTDLTIDTVVAEGGGEYGLHSAEGRMEQHRDLIAVTCHVCATRTYADRKHLGKKTRCAECGTILPIVEVLKSEVGSRSPQKIDDDIVGQYDVQPSVGMAKGEVTIPFHCRLCDTLLRGSLAEVGTALTCPDCGTATVVPPPKQLDPKAFVGAAAGEDVGEYGIRADVAAAGDHIPVLCKLCHSRLMARTDQVGQKVTCPDCGAETVVPPPSKQAARAFMGVMAEEGDRGTTGRDVPVKERENAGSEGQKTPAGKKRVRKVVYVGVDCPRCGTRIQATDRHVGKKVRCPDCEMAVTVPPPKEAAVAESSSDDDLGEYGVSGPVERNSLSPMSARALPVESGNEEPPDRTDDPDYKFLQEVDRYQAAWQWKDRTDKWGFLGHSETTSRWFGFALASVFAFAIPAVSLLLFGLPMMGVQTAANWFLAFASLAIAVLACLAWAGLLAGHLLAIVQDTSAGNRVVEGWPEGDWSEWIGESFYVFSSFMVSFVPVSILMQTFPPARPFSACLYTSVFWLTLPVALLSMLETGSILVPLSSGVGISLFRRPLAWGRFYGKSLMLIAVTVAMYYGVWIVAGPLTLPLLAPIATTFLFVYFRWIGTLGISVREVLEERAEADREPD